MSSPKINLNKEIIALFSGQASVVTTPKLYIKLTGSHSLAIVLNQCVYWSNKSEHKDGWFYKQYHEWFDEVHIPERTLRRRFDRLEQMGWITTKVKKIRGLNTKHIYPHMDKIIDSISIMLSTDCPDRPTSPVSPESEQKPCTKVAPTGQSGRSEPATLSDSSIYTEDYKQIKTTTAVSSFIFSETLDQNLLSQKLHRDERSDAEFMDHVVEHVDNHSDKQFTRLVRAQGALKLITRLKKEGIVFYAKGKQPKLEDKPKAVKTKGPFTQEELEAVQELNHALKMADWGSTVEVHMPNKERREFAFAVKERMKAMEAPKCQNSLPEKNARKNCSTSVSNLVSHLNLSQQGS